MPLLEIIMQQDLNTLLKTINKEYDVLKISSHVSTVLNVPVSFVDKLRDLNANITNQNHTADIKIFSGNDNQSPTHYDGIISKDIYATYIAYTSDCLPIVGIGKESCFLIHAGWQGLYLGILEKLINHPMTTNQTFDIYVGPHISKKYFTVKNDFIELWQDNPLFPEFIEQGQFDLCGYAKKVLQPITQSWLASHACTFSNQKIASYRRNGSREKTNLTLINNPFCH
jgi:copper oxidase (laccase) domain-containing protein